MMYHAFLQKVILDILIAGLVFGALFFWYVKASAKRKQILQNGVLVDGCIVDHRSVFLVGPRRGMSYYLTFRYEYQGTSYTHEVLVSERTYYAYADGRKISVRCPPDAPTTAVVEDDFFEEI